MRFGNVVEVVSSLTVAGVAVIMAYTYMQDRGFEAQGQRQESAAVIPDWETENHQGIRSGPADADIVITEFMDFQCPFCARLVPRVDSLLAEFPEDVALVFHHFPLLSHEYATAAAIAAECAHRQGRFWPMYRTLFARQRAYGIDPWEAFAEEAGIADLQAFSACIELPADSFPRIQYGRSLGQRTGATGTPTTWINGREIRLNTETVRRQVREANDAR